MKSNKNIFKFKLKNGLKVLYLYRPGKNTFYLEAMVNCGSIHEDNTNWGISHFLEHVIMSSTSDFTNTKLLSQFGDKIGGYYGASTSKNLITINGAFPKVEFQNAVYLLHQHLFSPTFDDKAIKIQRKVIMDETLNCYESRYYKMRCNWYKTRLEHPEIFEKFDPIGTPKIVKKLTKDNLVDWYKNFFSPDNIIIGASGGVKPDVFKKEIKKWFGKIKNSSHKDLIAIYEDKKIFELSKQTTKINKDKEFEKVYLDISFKARNVIDAKNIYTATLFLFLEYLANSSGSILFQELREKNGLVYDVSAYQYHSSDLSYWGFMTSFDEKYFDTVVSIIKTEVQKILKLNIDKDLYMARKDYILKRFLMRYDSDQERLYHYMNEEVRSFFTRGKTKILSYEEIYEIFSKIKYSTISKFIDEYFDLKNLNIFLYGKFNKKSSTHYKLKLNKIFSV